MKRLNPKKSKSLSLSSVCGLFIVISLSVTVLFGTILVRQDSACRELTPALNPSTDEAARGMICQIRPHATDLSGRLRVDIRNAGKSTFWGYMSTETSFAIRVDEKWYHWLGGSDVKSARFEPGSAYRTFVDLSDRSWGNLSDKGNLSLGINLVPGNHSVQVAFLLKELPVNHCFWIASNILKISGQNQHGGRN